MTTGRWLGVGLGLAIAACAMRPKSETPLMPDPHGEIDAAAARIDRNRAELGLEPSVAPELQPMTARPVCQRSESETCKHVCTLADAICEDAGKICEVEKKLPGDRWAADKCAAANDTCAKAGERCCRCP